jgi:hypothetical protein
MENKKLKFASNLVKKVLSGEKTVTWRAFDDKNLQTGDQLILIDRGNNQEFAQADIVNVRQKKFSEINNEDFVGHEEFSSREEMYKTYNSYYDGKVKDETIIKIIKFKLTN